jgi:hypothetical protein
LSAHRIEAGPSEGSPPPSRSDGRVTYSRVELADPALRDLRARVARVLAEILRRELRAQRGLKEGP